MLVCKGVRTLCPECRRVETLTVEERALLQIGDTAATCARGAGCPSCDQTGYDGKRYLLEVVTSTRSCALPRNGPRSGRTRGAALCPRLAGTHD